MTRCSFGFHVWGHWSYPVDSFSSGQAQHRFCTLCGMHKLRETSEAFENAELELYESTIKKKANQ